MSTVQISGNTYPVKDAIRALGGKWDAARKVWLVPADKATEAQALVAGAPAKSASSASYRPKKCCVCGVVQSVNSRGYPNVRIYKSGECQDCFEERKMGY